MKKIENPCEKCGHRMSCRRECFSRRDYIRAVHAEEKKMKREKEKTT